MKDIWDKPITADTDWGGDASTGGLPVSGRIVQEYIKSRLKTDEQLKAFIKAYLDENGMSADQGYVTLATEQTIKAIKDFEAGLKIGGSLITYDKDLNAFILRANLVTEGGITARALLDEVDVPTFMDGVVTDEVTISKADGVLRVLKAGLDKEELINILDEEKYVTQSWVKSYNAKELKKYVLKTDLPSDIVTLSIDQEITGIKNFANGFEIAGIKFSKSQDGTIFLDGNLVTSGGITARGTNTTQSPSLFDALPIDGRSIKRTAEKMLYVDTSELIDARTIKRNASGMLYVDADELGISGGGGSGSAEVTYDSVISALGYTPLSTAGGTVPEIILTKNDQSDSRLITINGEGISFTPPIGGWAFGNSININSTSVYASGIFGTGKTIGYYYYGGAYHSPSAVILPNGNVAIGDTASSEKLSVLGNVALTAGTSNPYIAIKDDIGAMWYVQYAANCLWFGLGTANSLSVDRSGNVSILGGLTTRYTSDRRLKHKIRPFRASEMLMSLGGVYQFEYIDSEVEENHIYGGSHIGLIYQNVVGSALNRMCYEREDGYGSLNYLEPSFISLIAGATMENTSEIEQLKKRVKQLEARV